MLYLLGLAAAITKQALDPFGPIETRNHRSIAMPFLRLEPRAPVQPQGQKSFSLGYSVANDYRQMQNGSLNLFEKYEIDEIDARLRLGLAHHSDLTVDLPILDRSGGFLDPLIDIWHRTFLQIHDNAREFLPYGLSDVSIPGSHRFGSAAGIGDVSIEYSHDLSSRLMGTVGFKLPTGDRYRILGSGNVDGAFGLQARVPWGPRWQLDFTGGFVAQGPATYLQSTRGLVHQESISIEHRANRRDNYVFQWQGEASAIQTGIPGSDSTNRVLSLGMQHTLSDRQFFETYFTLAGDWTNYSVPELVNIGAEFTFGFRVVSRF